MDKTILFLGAGNMAEGIIGGLLRSQVSDPARIRVCDISGHRMDYMAGTYGVQAFGDPAQALDGADILLLAVRPQDVGQLRYLKDLLAGRDILVISIISSTLMSTIEGVIGEGKLCRMMPNTLTKSGHGYSGLCVNGRCTEEDKRTLEAVADAIGQHMYVEEKLFNAWTGFATSGPLMIYKFIYGMIEGGIYSGFSLEQSIEIVIENIIGSGLNLKATGDHPLQAVDRLTTPGGVGIEHFKALEEGNFTNLCIDAVWAAVRKAESMADKYKVE